MSDDSGLMSEDFKDGKGILFIGMEGTGDKAKFTVTDEAKAFLETVSGGCPSRPRILAEGVEMKQVWNDWSAKVESNPLQL